MKNLQNGSAIMWVIVIIVVLLVAAGGYYLYKTRNSVPIEYAQQVAPQSITSNGAVNGSVTTPSFDSGTKSYKCVYEMRTDSNPNPYNLNGEVAKFKLVRGLLDMHQGNNTLPKTLSGLTDSGGSSMNISNDAYLYAYFPKESPIHYHLGMKIELNSTCVGVVLSELKKKSNFNSKTTGYVNGFDGTAPSILDSHDFNNGVPN